MDKFDQNYAEILNDPLYPAAAEKAKAKGFRLATPHEVRDSLDCKWHSADLYFAYGVNWVRENV